MSDVDWSSEHKEEPGAVRSALENVRRAGERKKAQRRSAVGAGSGAAMILAVVAFVGANGGFGGGSTPRSDIAQPAPTVTSPQLSLAAQVTQAATAALANLRSVEATEHVTNYDVTLGDYTNVAGTTEVRYRLVVDGSYWSSTSTVREGNPPDTFETAYDATTGKVTRCMTAQGQSRECQLNWGPPQRLESSLAEFQSAVNQAAKASNVAARDSRTGSRDTWTLEFDTRPAMSTAAMHVVLDVDRATGLPIHLVTTVDGKRDKVVSLSDIKVNEQFDPSQLRISVPDGVRVADLTGEGSEGQVTFAASASRGLPTSTIEGFTTKEVWTTVNGHPRFGTTSCPDNAGRGTAGYADQISRSGVLSYQVEVIDRSTCDIGLNIRDTITDFNNSVLLRTVTATGGAMDGTEFQVYRQPNGELFVGGANNRYVVYIIGDATEEQLVAMVSQFQAR